MIRLIQRHCNFSTNSEHKPRPTWFNREAIFDSFISTFDDRIDFTAFHDSGAGPISDHFLSKKSVKTISQHGGNDAQSFLNVINWTIEQEWDNDDIIYFTEDDYLHKPGWIDVLEDGVRSIGADYFTLYDHPDKYYLPMYENLQSKIIVTNNTHWRTTPSTTNTYACKLSTLKRHIDIHIKYCDLQDKWTKDHDKFIHLWNIGSNLISCIPGYSSHIEDGMLSPLTDWSKI